MPTRSQGDGWDVPDAPAEDEDDELPPLIGGFPEGYQYEGPMLVGAPELPARRLRPAWGTSNEGMTTTRDPLYRAGAQNTLFSMTAPQLAGLQEGLASVGLLSGSYQASVLDEKTMTGFGTLLYYSNALGLDYYDTLTYMQNQGVNVSGGGGGGGGGGRAAPTIQLTSSDDLSEVFRSAIYQSTGTYNSDINVDAMVDAYHSLERNYQTRAQSGAGGEVERAPNAQTFAVQQVREEDPAAVEAASFAQMGEALSTILGPGA